MMQRWVAYGLKMLLAWATASGAYAQGGNYGTVTGGFQLDGQYYFPDSAIGTPEVPENILFNGYGQIVYRFGKFEAGLRYEAYQNPLLGINNQYQDQGIANRYVKYGDEGFEVTAGNFYEQFGSGMVLRGYWEPLLGTDNAFDGFRVVGRPFDGLLTAKALIGRQRFYWEPSPGLVRAGDVEVNVTQLVDTLTGQTNAARNWQLSVGGSAVSRYLEDDDPELVLPENVGAFAGRFNFTTGGFNLQGEYARKGQDPALYSNIDGKTVYNEGEGIFLAASYSQRGYGFSLQAKRLENMDFRSSRQADFSFNELPINFLPPMTRQHTWRLQTLYLYATQPRGEMGLMADVFYNFDGGTALGGKYGTTISLNASQIYDISRDTTGLAENLEYPESEYLERGEDLFYEDINLEVYKKFTSRFKATFAYVYVRSRLELQGLGTGLSETHLGVADMYFKLKPRKTLHLELQHMWNPNDAGNTNQEGNWAFALVEYTVAPHWFFVLSNEFNYGNPDPDRRLNYYSAIVGHNFGPSRIQVGYARQRQGIICVGGVCRVLPASNGIQASISTTF